MNLVRVSLFGRFDMACGQLSLTGFDRGKARELFCYLLLHRQSPHPREALATLLWECSQTDRPNRCLRKTIWQLRSALNSQGAPLSDQVLIIEPDWIQLNPEADLWLDVAVFEQAFLRYQHLPGAELERQDVRILEDAVNLYRGGLQESWYQDWYLYQRERFQHMYLIILDKLMAYCEAHHRYEDGLAYGTRILLCERARERTHRRMMRLHYLSGGRTAALRQYERCVRVLDEELEVGPARRTTALYDLIRTDQLADPALEPLEIENELMTATYPLRNVLHSLSRLLEVLGRVQQEIHTEMQALELTIDDQD